jgi:hypothetical protein
LANLDAWHSKPFRGIGHLLTYPQERFAPPQVKRWPTSKALQREYARLEGALKESRALETRPLTRHEKRMRKVVP